MKLEITPEVIEVSQDILDTMKKRLAAPCSFIELGKQGYANGIKAPVHCKVMMNHIAQNNLDMTTSLKALKQWNKGWTLAHLAASEFTYA